MTKKKTGEIEKLRTQLARVLADYDNLKKRTDKEREEFTRYANQKLIERLLPAMELFDRVREHVSDPGLEMALDQLKQTIRQAGVAEIAPLVGEKFDETRHEVVETVSPDDNDRVGTIATVIRWGAAWIDGRLILPAKVKVFGNVSEKKEELEKEMLRGDYV